MSRASILRLLTLACIWGASFLFIKIGLTGFSPTEIVFVRIALGAAVLLGILHARGRRLPTDPRTWLHLAVAAIFGNVLPYFLFAWAEQTVASNLTGVLNSATPLFTLGIAVAVGREGRVGGDRVVGLLLGFVGVVVVLAPWQGLHAAGPLGALPGEIAAVGAAMSYAISYIYIDRFIAGRGLPPLVLAGSQLTAATPLAFIAAMIAGFAPVTPHPPALASVAALGALGTGVAYILMYRLITDEGPTPASTVTYVIPIVAVMLGVLALGEPLGWNLIVGTAVILIGVALTNQVLGRAVLGRGGIAGRALNGRRVLRSRRTGDRGVSCSK
ncbi:MAG: DMT family transporter [Streptosporangiaceae bacterium]